MSLEKSSYQSPCIHLAVLQALLYATAKWPFPNKSSMRTVLLLLFSADGQRSFHFTESPTGGLSHQPAHLSPSFFHYPNPGGFLSLTQKCPVISFLHRTCTNVLSFAWNVIFSSSTKLTPTQELLPRGSLSYSQVHVFWEPVSLIHWA